MIIFNKTNSIYNSLDESPKAHRVELRWKIIIEQAAAHKVKATIGVAQITLKTSSKLKLSALSPSPLTQINCENFSFEYFNDCRKIWKALSVSTILKENIFWYFRLQKERFRVSSYLALQHRAKKHFSSFS